jgi:hypothetical protein
MRYKAVIGLLMLSSVTVWGHGENQPGPHGGVIRMPGAYHTEALLGGKNQLKVYLLDMQFKNPSTLNSSLSVVYEGKKKLKMTCTPQEDLFFLCALPKNIDMTKKGKLTLNSQREGQRGIAVSYDLPLKLETKESHAR